MSNLNILILAAGEPNRKSYGPKCLLKYKDKTVLEHQIEIIRKVYPKAPITIVLGYEYKSIIKELPKSIKYLVNYEFDSSNAAYSIHKFVQNKQHKDTIIVYSDIIFNEEAINFALNQNSVVIGNPVEEHIGTVCQDDEITRFTFSKELPCFTGIFYIKQEFLANFSNLVYNNNRYKKYFIYEILNKMLDCDLRLFPVKSDKIVIDELYKDDMCVRLSG